MHFVASFPFFSRNRFRIPVSLMLVLGLEVSEDKFFDLGLENQVLGLIVNCCICSTMRNVINTVA